MACELSRRELLLRMASAAGVSLLGLAGCGGQNNAPPPAAGGPPGLPPVPEGVMAIQNPDGTFKVPNGAKVAPGSGLLFNMPPNNAPGFIYHDASGALKAISARCTHAGGQVEFVPEGKDCQFHCPLHNSVFGSDGHVLNGPANLPLLVYAVKTAGNDAIIKVKT